MAQVELSMTLRPTAVFVFSLRLLVLSSGLGECFGFSLSTLYGPGPVGIREPMLASVCQKQ